MAGRACNCLPVLPVAAAGILFLSAVVSYAVGLRFDETIFDLIVPYPSDLLVRQPQRGVFAAGLGASACFSMAVILLRYIQIKTCFPTECTMTNAFSFLTGVVMVLGQATVASFSLEESVTAHFSFACMYFAGSCLYMITQAHITRVITALHSRSLFRLRAMLSVLAALCPCAYACGRMLAPISARRYYIPQVAEWILAFITVLFTATVAVDFKQAQFRSFLVSSMPATGLGQNGGCTAYRHKRGKKSQVHSLNCPTENLTTAIAEV